MKDSDAEVKFRGNEEKYRRLVELAGDGVWEYDAEARTTFVNRQMAETFGYSVDEMLGVPVFEFCAPECAAVALAKMERCKQHISDQYEMKFRRKDGRTIWTLVRVTAVHDDNGNIVGGIGVINDITERKCAEGASESNSDQSRASLVTEHDVRESEQRLSLFVQQSPLAAIEWNTNFEVVSWNPAAERIFGYSSQEAIGRHAKHLILPHPVPAQIDEVWHHLLTREGGNRNINENVTKDGRAITCEWFNSPLVGPDGQVRGVASLVEDITDRMRSEEALRESEEKYRTLFESANDCIHLIDGDRWVECNSRGLAMYGCSSRAEMIGTTPADFSPPTQPDGRNSLEKAREVIAAARSGRPQRFYWKHLRKDGALMDVEVSLNRVLHGKKEYVLAIERDITEQKRAEEALRASEAFLDSIIEHSPYSTWVSDEKGTLIRLNQVCRDTLHITNEDVVGKYNVFDDRLVQDQGLIPLIKQVFEHGKTVRFTMRYDSSQIQNREAKQPTDLILDLTISPVLDARNRITNAIVQHCDITERYRAGEALRQSQEKYRVFFEQNPAGNYISTPAGSILACNPAFVRMFGFASEEEARQSNFFSLYPSIEARERFLVELKQRGHLEYYDEELRRRDGSALYVTKNATGTFNESGELYEIHGFLIDETERRQTERQLRQAQKMEAIGNLAGGVAHDFNNILGVVIGHGELLLEEPEIAESAQRHAQAIIESARRAATLTRQLLAFSRKQLLQPKVLNLNRVILGIEGMIRRLIGDDIEVKTSLATDLGNVSADPVQMEQVILNFCVNARDAMPEGGKITFETRNVDVDELLAPQHFPMKPGRYVRLAVSDTGTGMDKETLSHVFEPFFTTKAPEKGTGLGLATVYGIVKQSGGHVWAYSEPGRGSTFSVYLPTVSEGMEFHAQEARSPALMGGSETILVVEDLASLRDMVRELLESFGYRVLEAEDAQQADTIVDHNKDIALLLTDLSLPKTSGFVLAKSLLKKKPGLKILYMSGYAKKPGLDGINEVGTDFLQKPFTREDLGQKIRGLLDNVE